MRRVIESILQRSWPRRASAALALALVAGEAVAVPRDISGSASGFGAITNVACLDPGDEGTDAESIRLSFSSSTSEGVVFVDAEGTSLTDDTTVSISFSYDLATGAIIEGSGSAAGSETDAAINSVLGVVSDSELELAILGEDFGDTCASFSGVFVFNVAGLSGVAEVAGVINRPENTASVEATAPIQLQRQIKSFTGAVFGRISDVRRGRATGAKPIAQGFMVSGGSGVNAGDGFDSLLGAWVAYSFADFENDFEALRYDGSRHSGLAGVDFSPTENLILGIAAGYERASQDTRFNSGEVDTAGFTVTPYLGYRFSDAVSVDFAAGYSGLNTDQFRTTLTGTRVTSDADSTRWFWGGNVNATEQIDRWYLTGSIGITWARESVDAYEESDGTRVPERTFRFGQWRVGGEVAYAFDTFEPYASATYQRDYATTEIVLTGTTNQPANDLDDVFFAAGIRFFGMDNLSASAEYTRVMTRADYVENGLNLLLRMLF